MEESHLTRTDAHHYEHQDPQYNPAGLHPEGEEEKNSVLMKVKAKAKKIKNTLTKHGHGHDHDAYGDEDEDDQDMVDDHDPPVRPFNREEDYGQPKSKLGGLTATDEVLHVPEDKHVSFSTRNCDIGIHNPTEKNVYGEEESLGQERNKIGFLTASTGKNIIGQEQNLGGQMGRIGMDTGMEKDPHGPNVGDVPTHVQAKATDPDGRGSKEVAGITPILRSFDKMGIYDKPEQKPKAGENLYTGSHDQFGPEPLNHENLDSVPENYDPNNPQDFPRNTSSGNPLSQTSTYTEKLAFAASSIADAAESAKNVVASKLGYSENESTGAPHQELHGQGDTTKPASTTDYAQKIAATVYGKVAGAGSTVASKVQGSGTGTGTDNEGQDKGVSVKEYLAEKLKPGEEDKALSEMITGSFIKHMAEIEKNTKVGERVSNTGGGGGGGGRGVSDVMIKDDLHKREAEGSGGDRKPTGKVRESEEVAKRLGSGGEEGGKGVVDRVKGVFGSWLGGKGGETQTTPGTTYAGDDE